MRITAAALEQREAWDAFVRASPTGSFLQSWAWGEFQTAAGFPVRRLLVEERAAIQAVSLCVERALPFGQHYIYIPWGPVWPEAPRGDHAPTEFLHALRSFFSKEREHLPPVSIRVEPRLPPAPATIAAIEHAGFTVQHQGVQPTDTLVVDLRKSEDDLLRRMHPKTRYNIRVAMRHGVTVEERTTVEGLRTFLTLAREVEERGTFHYHPPSYYETMLRTLGPARRASRSDAGEGAGMLRVLIASHHGLPLAAALLLRYGTTVTYTHGASSQRHAHVMASHLLHWEALRRSKEGGAHAYDFFGIAPPGSAQHPWAGITRFKRGFGGMEEHFVGIADAVLDPVRYRFYTMARAIRGLLNPS